MSTETKSVQICFRVSPDVHARILRIANELPYCDKGDFLRDVVSKGLARIEWELALDDDDDDGNETNGNPHRAEDDDGNELNEGSRGAEDHRRSELKKQE